MPRKEPEDFKAKLAKASLPEGSVTICLDGRALGEYNALKVQLLELRAQTGRLAGNPKATMVARRMEVLREEMADSEVQVHLRALPRRQWAELVAAHPPRKGNTGDESLGLNVSSFQEALVLASTGHHHSNGDWVPGILALRMTEDDTQSMLDELTDNQFGELFDTAWGLNRRDVSVPFSGLVSETLRTSDETSKPQPMSA